MFKKNKTAQQRILEEFPCLWALEQTWGPRSRLLVDTIQSNLSCAIDETVKWWVYVKTGDRISMLPLNEPYQWHNLATAVIGTLANAGHGYITGSAPDTLVLIGVEEDVEGKKIVVYKAPKELDLHQICMNRAVFSRNKETA
jgi:hypothetical protein